VINVSDNSKDFFLSQVYKYYPKGVSPIQDDANYKKQPEYETLIKTIQHKEVFPEDKKETLVKDLKDTYDLMFKDFTLFSWLDRSYSLQSLLKRENLICEVLCINISVIIPYFTIYILKTERENMKDIKRKYPPAVSQELLEEHSELVKSIKSLLVNQYDLRVFPNSLENEIIEGIGFQDIPIGKFTFFNAFFHESNNYTQFF
jgi:hypothetical protein